MMMIRHKDIKFWEFTVRIKATTIFFLIFPKSHSTNPPIIIINTDRDYVQQLNAINGIIKPVNMLDIKLTL